MSKEKVYLAKSNRADPNLVGLVRQTLSNYDIEIVEYSGGEYSHKPLLKCDWLVIVPDLNTSVYDEGIIVGKGLYEQIIQFEKHVDLSCVSVVLDKNLTVSEICDYFIDNSDNYVEYGVIGVMEETEVLTDVLNKTFNKAKTKKSVDEVESNYYILINKKS